MTTPSEFLLNPHPHKVTRNTWLAGLACLLVVVIVWFVSLVTFSSEPAAITPARIEAPQYVQAIVQANDFSTVTSDLMVHVALKASAQVVNERGLLREPLVIRVTDNRGATQTKFRAGDPLSTQDVVINMEGSVNNYPFDTYSGSFSIEAESVDSAGGLHPLPMSIGTEHAKTGWRTDYQIDRGTSSQAKITVVSMKREDFTIAFSVLLALLMILLTVMALLVGAMCITNQRVSDPGIVGWLIALLFALPFVRDMLPGSPPLGCLFDVLIFAWCIAFTMISVIVSLVAWIRQSSATLKHERGQLDSTN